LTDCIPVQKKHAISAKNTCKKAEVWHIIYRYNVRFFMVGVKYEERGVPAKAMTPDYAGVARIAAWLDVNKPKFYGPQEPLNL
jgi:hypothetical protein